MALGSQPRWTVRPAAGAQIGVDVGLPDYMLRVYNYMASGLWSLLNISSPTRQWRIRRSCL